jgi:hypothetical protein
VEYVIYVCKEIVYAPIVGSFAQISAKHVERILYSVDIVVIARRGPVKYVKVLHR